MDTLKEESVNDDNRVVFFFDVDNCLYPRSTCVQERMAELIENFIQSRLSLSHSDAHDLHNKYFSKYGLAIYGLVRFHGIDPNDFNEHVDNALELNVILKFDKQLRQLLEDIDRKKVKLWLFTNAYVTHGKRVVKLLGIEDLFEGITYCDYTAQELICKPMKEAFAKAMHDAQVDDVKKCFFVDDSILNVKGARDFGWTSVHLSPLNEDSNDVEKTTSSDGLHVNHLSQLRNCFPSFFRSKQV